MSNDTKLGPGEEFDAIRDLIARFGDVASGIGDDAAVLDVPRGERLVVSTDTSVEGRHFRAGWLSAEEIGYRAVTAALSDLAAMAAQPLAVLWAVDLPEGWRPKLLALADGARDAVRAVGTKIVGGNLSGADALSITTTVLGSAYRPLTRAGARDGDRLYVTGRLGGPALALASWLAEKTPEREHRARFARPQARIIEARWLADHGVTAGLDISDGLASDARHLAAAGGIGLTVHIDRLPTVQGADAQTAARSGEEYELLVTAPSLDTAEFERRFGIPLTAIGEVGAGGGVAFLDRGRPVEVGRGHDHFSK
jgi:thiamine-monophosphate kinase